MPHCPLHVPSPAPHHTPATQREGKEALTPLQRDRDSSGEWQPPPWRVGETGCNPASCEQEGLTTRQWGPGTSGVSLQGSTHRGTQGGFTLCSTTQPWAYYSLCGCKRITEGCTCRVLCKHNTLCQNHLALSSTRRGWM